MKSDKTLSRRNFVASTSLAGAGAILMAFPGSGRGEESQAGAPQPKPAQPGATQPKPAQPGTTQPGAPQTRGYQAPGQRGQGHPPTPAENLTAQHGALSRLLLVYEDASKQMQNGQQVDAKTLYNATKIIQTAVIELHAPLEEQYVYPRLEQSGQHAATIKTLREQHAAARDINTMLMEMTKSGNISDAKQAAQAMNDFRRMLAAHVAREHSEIFPAFREMMPADQYMELGQQFQQKERSALGGEGFAQILSQVASIETAFGFRDLSQFTAKAGRAPVAAAERIQETPTAAQPR